MVEYMVNIDVPPEGLRWRKVVLTTSDPAAMMPSCGRFLRAHRFPGRPRSERARRRPAGRGHGAGWSGVHPRRCRHRQDPGDHPPDRLPRAGRRDRGAARAGGDVHRPGRSRDAFATRGARRERVSARTFHAAALRQVRYFAPRILGGRAMPELIESKARLVTLAARAGPAYEPTAPSPATSRARSSGQSRACTNRTSMRSRRRRRAGPAATSRPRSVRSSRHTSR